MKLPRELIRQILLYGIIGGSCALLDLLLFTLMYKGLSINEFLANVVSVHIGIAMSFILNRKFNFKKTDRILFRATSFYLTGLFGLALSEGLLWLGTRHLNFAVIPVKIATVFIVAGMQFIINKSVAFRK
jgi:putative flippase GtrA